MSFYAIEYASYTDAQEQAWPIIVTIHHFESKAARQAALTTRWRIAAASERLVQHAIFMAHNGAPWPLRLRLESARATPIVLSQSQE